jgi:glucose-1-phosphatase
MSDSVIHGIFFDLGNVLVGIDSARFAEKMRELTGLDHGQLRSIFGGGLVTDYECGRMDDDQFLAALCEKAGVEITREDFNGIWTCMFPLTPLLPEELLKDLSLRYPLWAISNTNRMHFEFIRERYRFMEYFRGWSLSYEVGAAKPDPAIFAHALRETRIAPDHALFIDDQWINVEAARNLGIHAVQFLDSEQVIGEFRMRKLLTE